MILTPHLLVGAAIGSKIHSWPEIAALAIASHYLFDAIPHPQYKVRFLKSKFSRKEVVIDLFKIAVDFASGFFFVAFVGIKSLNFPYMMFGMAMAVLPDFFQLLYRLYKNRALEIFQKIHDYFHFEKKMVFAWHGIFTIIVSLTSALAILY